MKLACLSVDLDSVPHYCRIYGIDERHLSEEARGAVYRRAVPRFTGLLRDLKLPCTFFAVGEDLTAPESAEAILNASRAGHEVANHTFSHDYALTRRGPDEMARDIREGALAIQRATGKAPVGFRAPGYTITAQLVSALASQGVRYDSSAFPAAPYWAAKAAIMGALAARGRPSRGILDRPGVLLAPRLPYHPSPADPYRRGQSPVLELPVTVERFTRVPFIGASLTLLPEPAVRLLYRALRREPFLCLELHGIDLLDAADVELRQLSAAQRDLQVPWEKKRERIRGVLTRLAADFELVTLEEAAARLA